MQLKLMQNLVLENMLKIGKSKILNACLTPPKNVGPNFQSYKWQDRLKGLD